MKVSYTREALSDLNRILTYIDVIYSKRFKPKKFLTNQK